MTPHHSEIIVKVGRRKATIDKEIAPLIKQMWLAWIDTSMCCQEAEPGLAWIHFPSIEDLRKFLNIVSDNTEIHDMNSLYRHILPSFNSKSDSKWVFTLGVADDSICNPGKPSHFSFNVDVWFPVTDIPVLINRLKEHNRMNKAIH
jgi:hypothetical protein